jgi:hypothetical protein
MASPDPSGTDNSGSVVSPFASAQASVGGSSPGWKRFSWPALLGILVILAGIAAFAVYRYLHDPYRTLEPFSVGRYLDNYRGLAGSKFRGDLRVEADLGWKEGVGRLMVFSSPNDGRSFVVLIPPKLSGIYFTKGQTYLAELEIKEGGLVYANSCKKN